MTEHRTATRIETGHSTQVFFEGNQPSSMSWVENIGAICEFDVNLNERLIVDSDMMHGLACNAPLNGKTLLIFGSDPYDIEHFDVPKYLIDDVAYMDSEEREERCPTMA